MNAEKNNIKLMWFFEILIWCLFIIIFTSGIMVAKYYYKKSFNTYQIFIQDVDGLIVGSPVRMMGVQIGYVRQVSIVNELVFVDFIITKKNIKIPRGYIVTVAFNGLAGSKSLEIFTPDKVCTSQESYLVVQNPARIKDAFNLIFLIYDKIMDITYRGSKFAKNIDDCDCKIKQNGKNKPLKEVIKETNIWLEEKQKIINKPKNKTKEVK